MRAVMLDTQGPEIRSGTFVEGMKGLEMKAGDTIKLSCKEEFRFKQSSERLWCSYQLIHESLDIGSRILLDDGAIELVVQAKATGKDGDIICRVSNSGRLGNRKSINLPGLQVKLPAMCDKDRDDIRWGVENDVDFIAASFTRRASDVRDIRSYVQSLMPKYHAPQHPIPKIISKIENMEALENFDEILKETDAVMVARGDLGVEIPLETLATVQKEIVKKCNLAGKPVIVATQMLESMQNNPRPTRAEVTDVTNAVLDGADCVMLSGESAKGKFAVESVRTMNSIVQETERWVSSHGGEIATGHMPLKYGESTREALARAVVEASRNVNAKCIFVITQTGETSQDISKFKPNVPILTFIHDEKIGKQLQLYRGVHPILSPRTFSYEQNSEKFNSVVEHAKSTSFVSTGDIIIVVAAEEATVGLGQALTMRIATVN